MSQTVRDLPLGGTPLTLYRLVARAADAREKLPALSTLAAEAGVGASDVSSTLKTLQQRGVLTIEDRETEREGRQRRYVLPDGRATQWGPHIGARRRKGAKRPCLCCGNTFISEWIGNRLCNTCTVKG